MILLLFFKQYMMDENDPGCYNKSGKKISREILSSKNCTFSGTYGICFPHLNLNQKSVTPKFISGQECIVLLYWYKLQRPGYASLRRNPFIVQIKH